MMKKVKYFHHRSRRKLWCVGPATFARGFSPFRTTRDDINSRQIAAPVCSSTRHSDQFGLACSQPSGQRTRWAQRGDQSWLPLSYAARCSETTGKCRLPSWKSTCSANRSPGCPAMSVRGAAQDAPRGQRSRGSMRGCRLAGRKRKYTSLGVPPLSVV